MSPLEIDGRAGEATFSEGGQQQGMAQQGEMGPHCCRPKTSHFLQKRGVTAEIPLQSQLGTAGDVLGAAPWESGMGENGEVLQTGSDTPLGTGLETKLEKSWEKTNARKKRVGKKMGRALERTRPLKTRMQRKISDEVGAKWKRILDCSGGTLKEFLRKSEGILGRIWEQSGSDLGTIWGQSGANLGPIWAQSGTRPGHIGTMLGPQGGNPLPRPKAQSESAACAHASETLAPPSLEQVLRRRADTTK